VHAAVHELAHRPPLLRQRAPEARGVLGHDDLELLRPRGRKQRLIAGALSRAAADGGIGVALGDGEPLALGQALAHAELVLDGVGGLVLG
jgi:hypothetical protein